MGKPEDPTSTHRDALDDELTLLARRALHRKAGALPPPSDLDDDLLLRFIDSRVFLPARPACPLRTTNHGLH